MIEDYELESFEHENKKLTIQSHKGLFIFIGVVVCFGILLFSLVGD